MAIRGEQFMRAVDADIASIIGYLQDLFGKGLTAVIAGVADPVLVAEWAVGEGEPPADAERRLRAAFDVAESLMQVESRQTVQTWFMGMNPLLDDRAPAVAIADDPAAVKRAALSFLAEG
jgi:hypothetical protein